MYFPLRPKVGLMGLFGGTECSEESLLAISRNSRAKPVFVGVDAKQTDAVVLAGSTLILQIRLASRIAQVRIPVVISHAVDVVDIADRKRSGHVEPRETVLVLKSAAHPDLSIAKSMKRASTLADFHSVGSLLPAREEPCARVVVKKLSQRRGFQHSTTLHHWRSS